MTDSKPSNHLQVHIDEADHKLFMSYGLLNRLLRHAGNDVNQVAAAGFSPDVRDKMFVEVLNKRGKTGVFESFTQDKLDDLNMLPEEGVKVIGWITEHLLDFFIAATESIQRTEKKFEARTGALSPPSPTGTPA